MVDDDIVCVGVIAHESEAEKYTMVCVDVIAQSGRYARGTLWFAWVWRGQRDRSSQKVHEAK